MPAQQYIVAMTTCLMECPSHSYTEMSVYDGIHLGGEKEFCKGFLCADSPHGFQICPFHVSGQAFAMTSILRSLLRQDYT